MSGMAISCSAAIAIIATLEPPMIQEMKRLCGLGKIAKAQDHS